MIVTTNFDRLMERALEEVGVVPSVVASTDAILGAEPLAHARCTVIKIHGDYLDTRLKNTPAEIGKYDRATNRLLRQVFDEYGLIVCGWSAEWDHALRSAVEKAPSRRYTMYWSAYRDVTGSAKTLCDQRAAQIINGLGADEFFTRLGEKVSALKEMDRPHPLSAAMAVATLKKYLPENRDRIRMHDLVIQEVEKAAIALFGNIETNRQKRSVKEYEAQIEIPLSLLASGGYWGKNNQRRLWLNAFRLLCMPRTGHLPGFTARMDYYPAYLALHAFGISALAGGRTANLAYVLAGTRVKTERGQEITLVHRLAEQLGGGELDHSIRGLDTSYMGITTPSSVYAAKTLKPLLCQIIPDDSRYDEMFARFEYLYCLVLSDVLQKEYKGPFPAHPGLYMTWANVRAHYGHEIEKRKEAWPLLKAGLFDGSIDRLRMVKAGFDESIARDRFRYFGF